MMKTFHPLILKEKNWKKINGHKVNIRTNKGPRNRSPWEEQKSGERKGAMDEINRSLSLAEWSLN